MAYNKALASDDPSKITRGKIGTAAFVITFFGIMYFGGSILLIQKGSTTYAVDKNQIESMLNKDTSINYIVTGNENKPDFIPATVFAIMNDMTNGWILHFHTVIFVGELEALAVLIFYRKVYRSHTYTQV